MPIYNKSGTSVQTAYNQSGNTISSAYNINGELIFGTIDYTTYSYTSYCSVSVANMQGFDIHNGIIFQFRAGSSVSNTMCTINANGSSIIQNGITASSDHGDSASFSDTYVSGDTYPLIYVTSDTNPAKVYINRVTQTSSTLYKTLSFPLEKTGYYAAAAIDFDNDILYMFGYSEQNYLTDNGGSNKTVISKWDLSNLTDNGDSTFTPQFVSVFERAFIYCTQGQQYHDGMIWASSGYTGSEKSYIYALNPSTGETLYTVDLDTTTEVEGLSFISNTEMVVGLQGGTYRKYTFAIS